MSEKNAKHGQPKVPAERQRAEWRVICAVGSEDIPLSSALRHADGSYTFSDDAGMVADFPSRVVTGVIRKPPRDPVQVTLPARFVTQPAAVREFQAALAAAFGVQVILLPPSSKAADAVSDPQ